MKIRLTWNKELKKLAAAFIIAFLTGIIALNAGMRYYDSHWRREYQELMARVLGNILDVYPDVSEEELIRALEGQEKTGEGQRLLERYGIYEEYGAKSFQIQEVQIRFMVLFLNLLFVFVFLLLAFLLFVYLARRQERIYGLESYMEALNREGYKLVIEDNGDDELSGLRNEIYKLTVMLKEQACLADAGKRALADSVANISHQLKTPLTSMTVLIDNLSEDRDMDPATRQHFISEIMYQLTGMTWLISTMLKISRLDAGVVELERERVSVSALVEEVLQKVEVAAEWKDISFALDIPRDTRIFADRRWTAEALSNIVKNAIEHSAEGASVKITAEENQVYTQIAVRDFGEGITEEQREKLFCRFYQGASAREDSIGIGLALSREIVEKQGGYISVDSAKGKGTRFVIKFIKQ